MKTIHAALREVTFDALREWAGGKIFSRGKSYIKNVDGLSRTENGDLAAWVSGSEEYATTVHFDDDGAFESFCTCPYDWGPCKHAVAVVLAAAEQVKQAREIPLIDQDGDLYLTLFGGDRDDDAWEEDDDEPDESADIVPGRKKARAAVGKILVGKSQQELLALLVDLAGRHPEVERRIFETAQLASGQVDKLVQSLRLEIRNITAEEAWYNPWKDEGRLPDYSHVLEQLQALLTNGHPDAVLELGAELWTKGNAQVEESHDEGDTAMEIAKCMAVVLRALPQTSLTPSKQLLWVVDRLLEDEFSILESGEQVLKGRAYKPAHWREVAETLEARLDSMAKPRTASFSDTYRRQRIMDRLLDAHGRSGQREKIIPLLVKEVDACQSYARLVDALLAAGDQEKARQWCIDGFSRTVENAPGIARGLQERLREMAGQEKRFDLVAAYRAQDFFGSASRQTYTELSKAAEKIECWPAIRSGVLGYLETGQRPDQGDRAGEAAGWPLPAPEVMPPRNKERRVRERFPDLDMLIDIAIMEKRLDDVVSLYLELRKTKRWGWETDKEVARAVAKTHPQVALDIWRAVVDSLIGQVKPKAYEEAANYLWLMLKVYDENKRLTDWQGLLGELRREHKAKRRLLEELDMLAKRKITD